MMIRSVVPFALLLVAACGGSVEPSPSSSVQENQSAGNGDSAKAPNEAAAPAAKSADDCVEHAGRGCNSAFGSGTQSCERNDDGVLEWGPCQVSASSSSTPLVLVFDGAPVDFLMTSARSSFDLAGDRASHVTSWPSARTPWLALDRDGNGRIDDGSELFGSMTRLGSGLRATNGFEALAALDSNHDGAITAEDEAFGRLLLWADGDGDRVSSTTELRPVSGSIVRIDLAYTRSARCTNAGDCEVERASFVYRTTTGDLRTGEVVDVHLRHR